MRLTKKKLDLEFHLNIFNELEFSLYIFKELEFYLNIFKKLEFHELEFFEWKLGSVWYASSNTCF